jgi:hypothetical protein
MKLAINKEKYLEIHDKLFLKENEKRKNSLFRYCGTIEKDILILGIIFVFHLSFLYLGGL